MNNNQSNLQVIFAVIGTAYLSLFAIGALLYIRQFESVFESFEADIPFHTSLILMSYKLWGVFAAISGYITWQTTKKRNRSGMLVIAGLVFLSIILVPVTIWAMYGPVGANAG